jgi:hypothetical protein
LTPQSLRDLEQRGFYLAQIFLTHALIAEGQRINVGKNGTGHKLQSLYARLSSVHVSSLSIAMSVAMGSDMFRHQ